MIWCSFIGHSCCFLHPNINKNLPYHSPSVMNSKVLHALMYLADRPRRRKWRLPLPPALWLLTRYIPVIQFSSVSERTASRSKIPLYFLWRDRHRFERKKLRFSKKSEYPFLWLQSQVGHFKILSLFCFGSKTPGPEFRENSRERGPRSPAPHF